MNTAVGFGCLMHPAVIPALLLLLNALGSEAQGCSEAGGFFELNRNKECFKFIRQNATWEEANKVCKDKGLVMALPDKQSASTLREQLVKKYGDDGKRIDMWLDSRYNADIKKYVATLQQHSSMPSLRLDDALWYPAQPGPYISSNHCLRLLVSEQTMTKWPDTPYYSAPCNDRGPAALCQGCTVGSFSVGSNECFTIFRHSVGYTWLEADTLCKNKGLILAKPSRAITLQLRKYLYDEYKAYGGATSWLNAVGDGSSFVWQEDRTKLRNNDALWKDGSPASLHSNDPTDYCLVLMVDEVTWRYSPYTPYGSHPCFGEKYILCQVSDEPLSSPVIKKGQCPPTRDFCPTPNRNFASPIQCSSDQDCGDLKKCCDDTCLQYKTCKTFIDIDQTLVPNHVTGPRPYCENCGISTISVNRGVGNYRISGGEHANKGEYPWQVYLGIGSSSARCGGSIIKKRWILTAAHCFIHKLHGTLTVLEIRVGVHDLRNTSDSFSKSITFNKQDIDERVKIHHQYDPEKKINDIALIELKEDLIFTPRIWPVCLADVVDFAADKLVVASGWGKKNFAINRVSDILLEVGLDTIGFTECKNLYKDNITITETMVCTLTPGKDACQGDSGGALVMEFGNDGGWVQVGIASFGIGCGEPDKPGVWTNVAKYKDWIDQTTKNHQC